MKFLILISFILFKTVQARDVVFYSDVKVKNLDPRKIMYVEEWEIAPMVFEPIIKPIAAESLLRPALAESWKYTPSKLTFKIKKNLKFSDGSKLDAQSIKNSYQRLLILDKSQESILANCLSHRVKLKSLTESHPSIVIKENNLILNIKETCKKSLLIELSQANYGIVDTKTLAHDLMLKQRNIVSSGAFTISKQSRDIILTKNKYNWAWKNSKSTVTKFIITNNSNTDADLLRTNSVPKFRGLRAQDKKFILSLPNITWYLAFDCKENCKEKSKITQHLKKSYYDKARELRLGSVFNIATSRFFPRSFNLPKENFKENKSYSSDKCISLKFGTKRKDKSILKAISQVFRSLSYNVERQCENGLSFKIYPQFLHDELVPTLDFLANTVKSINNISEINNFLPDKNNKIVYSREELSRKFSTLNHVPLFHSRIVFFYSDDAFKDIFQKSGGYLSLIDLPQVEI